jgi:4-hydroxy-tetrahydrodipicolinate reductase
VVGTTGLGDDDLTELAAIFTGSNCVVAPNFAIGAVLMMRFAELAAPGSRRPRSSSSTTT